LFFPLDRLTAEAAALEVGKNMNLSNVEVIHREVMHPSEGTRIQIKGTFNLDIDVTKLEIPKEPEIMSFEELSKAIEEKPMLVVAGTIGEDEHSVGIREIIDIKHGGIEKFGIKYEYLGTSVSIEKMIDAAIELNANAILASTIISHDGMHYKNMQKLHDLAVEKGVRDKLIIAAGGTQVTPDIAIDSGMDAGFGRGSKGIHVATFLVKNREERNL
ncbi:MAG: OAM dimerization domain-containing protein, partial [Bacilli bacterium]